MEYIIKEAFLALVRMGAGFSADFSTEKLDWTVLQALAHKQGLSGVVLDGIEALPLENKPPKKDLLRWIGDVLQGEQVLSTHKKAAVEMALLFRHYNIRTYVLKGAVVAECYKKPEHRVSVDMDCFLLSEKGDFDAWSLGNDLVASKGFEVNKDFYKNSTFYLSDLTVENHKFLTPFRGNNKLKRLEIMLQSMIKEDAGKDRFDDSWLYRPPVIVTALFLIEHAYSHFLHEGLTWRHVLDWMLFSKKHKEEIDWDSLDAMIDEFGFRKFFDSYKRLGRFMLGEIEESKLTPKDKLMLDDIWADLTLPEPGGGLKNKFSIAMNTIQARWKYRYFADISMIQALLIQVKGFFFIKNPELDI